MTLFEETIVAELDTLNSRISILMESDDELELELDSTILMEDDEDSDDSGDFGDGGGDNDSGDFGDGGDDEEDDVGSDLDTKSKVTIRSIKEGINMLQEISQFIEASQGGDYNEISEKIAKLKYLFKQFILHLNEIDTQKVPKILAYFKSIITNIANDLKK